MSDEQLLHTLNFLTGPTAAGRLSGTPGAYRAARYLASELEALGFEPAGEADYLQPFRVRAARLTAPAQLTIDGQTFRHRRDYAELTALSARGSGTGRLVVTREDTLLDPRGLAGSIVLIPERPQGFDLSATAQAAAGLGVAALLVEHGEPEWFHKTVYAGAGRIPVLRLRKSLAHELAQMPGARVEFDLALSNEALPCNNVLGLIRGQSQDFTLALTAHYDHVGDDPDGSRFPGALDNASGVAAILQGARGLASHQGRPPFNVLAAFLTGEESGLWGAKHLVAKPPRPISAVVNLDGTGNESDLAAMRLGHKQRGDPLSELAEEVLARRGIQAQWISGSDDSSVFISSGIPTVGLGQQPTKPGKAVMHTPLDTLASLDTDAVQQSVQVILEIVNTLARARVGGNPFHERNLYHV